jgi:tetratricopeptide (TPR) repeat protein
MPNLPENQQKVARVESEKAEAFFVLGRAAAGKGQFDDAIEMFLKGLKLDPDLVEAHKEPRVIAMKRKASGGKPVGMFEKIKLLWATKDEKQNMLNAEKVLNFDPGSTDAMQAMIVAANKGGFWETAKWLASELDRASKG